MIEVEEGRLRPFEQHVLAGLKFVVLHTKGGAVKWFKVSPVNGTVLEG